MLFFLPLLFVPFVFALSSRSGPQHNCQEATITINITAHPQVISLAPPKNQSELAGLIASFTSVNSNVTRDVVHGQTTLIVMYEIWTLLCLPSKPDPSILEFAVHGINFDHSYWNFGGEGSQYNYVDAALKAGHAIFVYDRLGVGKSSKPDGIKEVQEDTEIEVAAELIRYIQQGKTGKHFQQIIGIGHSLGRSVVDMTLRLQDPDLFQVCNLRVMLMGGTNTALAAFGLTIAADQNHSRFGSLSNSYLATATISNDQTPFFYFPFFDPDVLRLASETKQTATIGEFLTLGANVAVNYTNPVLVVTGEKDFILCGGDCYQTFAGFDNLVQALQVLFPSVSNFSYVIPANIGHGINLHYGAQDVFKNLQLWISQLA